MKAVLCYHSVDDSGSVISTSPELFESQMSWLATSRFDVVPLSGLLADSRDHVIALTFDDGYTNFEKVALPVLERLGLPSTVFIVSRLAGKTNRWDAGSPDFPALDLMAWNAIEKCAAGGVDIGAHSRSHASLAGLKSERLVDEILGCAEDIASATGIGPRSFAYPYGSVDELAIATVSSGYDIAVTTELRGLSAAEHPYLIPRIDSYYFRAPARLEMLGTPAFDIYLAARRKARSIRRGAQRA